MGGSGAGGGPGNGTTADDDVGPGRPCSVDVGEMSSVDWMSAVEIAMAGRETSVLAIPMPGSVILATAIPGSVVLATPIPCSVAGFRPLPTLPVPVGADSISASSGTSGMPSLPGTFNGSAGAAPS